MLTGQIIAFVILSFISVFLIIRIVGLESRIHDLEFSIKFLMTELFERNTEKARERKKENETQ